jgi:hypothetical protein
LIASSAETFAFVIILSVPLAAQSPGFQ